MPLSKKEMKILDRAERAGIPLDRQAPTRLFNLAISGIVTEARDIEIFVQLGEIATSLAERDGFSCELKTVVIFPIITDPNIFSREDFLSYKRKDLSVFIGSNIDYFIWRRASRRKRVILAESLIQNGIGCINSKHLADEHKLNLMVYVDLAANLLK